MIKGVSAQNPHRPRFSADLTRSWAKVRRAAAVLRSEANFRETKRKMRFRLAVSLKLRSSHENRRGAGNRDSGRSPTKNIRQITETAGRPDPARPEPVLGRVPGGDDSAPKLAFGFPLGKSSGWRTFGSARRTMAKVERIEGFSITARQNRGTRRLLPATPEHPLTLPVLNRDFAKPSRPPTKPRTPLTLPVLDGDFAQPPFLTTVFTNFRQPLTIRVLDGDMQHRAGHQPSSPDCGNAPCFAPGNATRCQDAGACDPGIHAGTVNSRRSTPGPP